MHLTALELMLRLAIAIVLLNFIGFIKAEVKFPPTPCRSVFNYKVKNVSNEVYGYLKFGNDFSGDYQLEVRMSVARRTRGNIAILRLPNEDQIQCGADLEYEVLFPECDGQIPVLTFVKFNNKLYCTGPPARDLHGRGTSNLLEYDGLITDMHENTCESQNQQTTENISRIPVIVAPPDKVPDPPSSTSPKEMFQTQQVGCGILQEINGREHFPWLATIYHPIANASSETYHCSATLISKSHALTVAHCVVQLNPSSITIRMGRNNIKSIIPSSTTTIRKVKNINIHTMYEMSERGGNIAVLEFDHPVEFSDLVRPACLWNETDDLLRVVNERAIVVGWGADAKPKKFTMPIVSHETCLKSHAAFAAFLGPTSFCAGYRNGTIPCVGNSGGSLLLLREDGGYHLRGLTSTALVGKDERGCDGYNYNTFTDVAKFINWITSIINR